MGRALLPQVLQRYVPPTPSHPSSTLLLPSSYPPSLLPPHPLAVAVTGGLLFVAQQFAGINGVLYFSSATFKGAGVANGMLASAAVGVANLAGTHHCGLGRDGIP